MAGSTLTVTLTNSSSVTVTLPTADWPDAKTFIQQIPKSGGIFADDGAYYLASAIQKVVIS